MFTTQEITEQLIDQKNKKTYEKIVEEHLRKRQELKENLGLTNEDMNLQPSQAFLDKFEKMLKLDNANFLEALTKKYSPSLEKLTDALNKNLASLGIVFNWYYDTGWNVSLYGQSIYRNYLTEIDKNDLEQNKIIKLGKAYAAYAEAQDNYSLKKQNLQKLYDYLGIANLQKLSESFKKLFVDTGFYHKAVNGDEQAVSVLSGKPKGITLLAPYKPGLHVRMYSKNSKNEVRGFLLGFNLAGKLLFEPRWVMQGGKIILNEKKEKKEKIVEEYESVGALIQARKKYFNFMLETNLPRFLENSASSQDFFTEKQFTRHVKLWNEQANLSDEQLILGIEKGWENLPGYELLSCPSPKTNDSSEHPSTQNNCVLM